MKRFIALTTILALGGILLTGCNSSTATSAASSAASSTQATETSAQSDETSGSAAESTEDTKAPVSTHKVEVTDQSVNSVKDDSGDEYKTITPKLIVDGKDAKDINDSLSEYIKTTYPLKKDEYGVDGSTVSYAWGVRGDIVSIVLIVSELGTDGINYVVFNYSTDTLEPVTDEEVLKSWGITADDFNKKVADAYRAYWDSEQWLKESMEDLDKNIGAISSTTVEPFATPNGNVGAAGLLNISGSQFGETVKCFDLDTLQAEYFSNN